MKVLDYGEREALKESGRQEDIDWSHWHRFLSSLYGDGVEVNLQTVSPSFEEYKEWKLKFPGWSMGKLSRRHAAWNPSYNSTELPMNVFLEEFERQMPKKGPWGRVRRSAIDE